MRLVRLALFGAAVSAACACTTEGGAGFFIVQNQSPDEGCTIPTDVGSGFLSSGIIDSNAGSGYLFTPVVQSLFTPSETSDVDHVIFVQGADVALQFPAGDFPDQTAVRQMFSGAIFPGGTTSFGFEIVSADLLDTIGQQVGPGGRTNVRAEIDMFGNADGESVDAEPYFYNVEVCNGCLMEILESCDIPEGFEIQTGGACQMLQDGVVTCCMDETLGLLCPAPDPTGA
jgi:hypothetical protein